MHYHQDFEKNKGSFTPTTTDLVTERVKRNTQDFSDISYRGIQRRVVEMEGRRAVEHDQETTTGQLIVTCSQKHYILHLHHLADSLIQSDVHHWTATVLLLTPLGLHRTWH